MLPQKKVYSVKIAWQTADRRKKSSILKDNGGGTQAMSPINTIPITVPLGCFEEHDEHRDSSYDEQSPKNQKNLCTINLDGHDLSFIVNGKKDDPI